MEFSSSPKPREFYSFSCNHLLICLSIYVIASSPQGLSVVIFNHDNLLSKCLILKGLKEDNLHDCEHTWEDKIVT